MSENVRVSQEFANTLKERYAEFNKRVRLAYGREVDFTEFTRLIAQDVDRSAESVSNPVLQPLRQGRKGIRFEW
jgi:hypothetical protein